MVRHIGDKRVADGNVTATTKAQKQIIRKRCERPTAIRD